MVVWSGERLLPRRQAEEGCTNASVEPQRESVCAASSKVVLPSWQGGDWQGGCVVKQAGRQRVYLSVPARGWHGVVITPKIFFVGERFIFSSHLNA